MVSRLNISVEIVMADVINSKDLFDTGFLNIEKFYWYSLVQTLVNWIEYQNLASFAKVDCFDIEPALE